MLSPRGFKFALAAGVGTITLSRPDRLNALTFDIYNRHANKIGMANIAQTINCLHSLFLADGDRFVATPTFHVYVMYRPHQGARAVRVDVQAPDVGFRSSGRDHRMFRVAGSASLSGKDLTLTLVHSHAGEPAVLRDGANPRPADHPVLRCAAPDGS